MVGSMPSNPKTKTFTGYGSELRVGFQELRRFGLRLKPQLGPDGYSSVGQDIQVGDEPFDRAFVIKGYDPAAVRKQAATNEA